MSLDAIIENVRKAGELQVDKIQAQANEKVKKIREEAEQEAETIKAHFLSEGKEKLRRKHAIIEQQAIMQALQVKASARQALIQEIFDRVKKELVQFRYDHEYEAFFQVLLQEVIDELKPSLLKGQKMRLFVDKRDEKIVKNALKKANNGSIEISSELKCWGGCNAESEDGRVHVLNTLDERYKHALPAMQQSLLVYFEKKLK
mgnify:CR=1 FL=1